MELDLRRLADGRIACVHDAMTGRTMVDVVTRQNNVDVGSVTSVEWKRDWRVLPRIAGADPSSRCCSRTFSTSPAAACRRTRDQGPGPPRRPHRGVRSRRLQDAVLVQSFHLDDLTYAASRGLASMRLSGTSRRRRWRHEAPATSARTRPHSPTGASLSSPAPAPGPRLHRQHPLRGCHRRCWPAASMAPLRRSFLGQRPLRRVVRRLLRPTGALAAPLRHQRRHRRDQRAGLLPQRRRRGRAAGGSGGRGGSGDRAGLVSAGPLRQGPDRPRGRAAPHQRGRPDPLVRPRVRPAAPRRDQHRRHDHRPGRVPRVAAAQRSAAGLPRPAGRGAGQSGRAQPHRHRPGQPPAQLPARLHPRRRAGLSGQQGHRRGGGLREHPRVARLALRPHGQQRQRGPQERQRRRCRRLAACERWCSG